MNSGLCGLGQGLAAWTYSYGDSAGFTPVFPFNLPIESAEPNPEQK